MAKKTNKRSKSGAALAATAPSHALAKIDSDIELGLRVTPYTEAQAVEDDELLARIEARAAAEEIMRRAASPAGDDPLLVFSGPMTREQIFEQLKALQEKARRGPIH